MVFIAEVLPGHSLGWAIIGMTLIVRLILFMPNQKAMRSQRKLQKLQPEIEALKKKHGTNQQMLAMETMALYKKRKINPMSSCLPILLQMPILIGIYFVVQGGVAEHLSYLLYAFQSEANLGAINPHFFGLNLEVPNIWVLPFLVGAAQYFAVKLSMAASSKTKKDEKPTKKKPQKQSQGPDMAEQMQQMQKVMLYALPLMIGIFTATFPAGVGIYWLTSTLFGIGQQKVVNYQLDKPKVKRKEG